MKTIFVTALALFTLQATAQETSIKKEGTDTVTKASLKKNEYTPEVSAGMKTKKLAAELDLNTDQQNQVYEILLENAKKNEDNKMNYKKMVEANEKMDKTSLKETYKKEQSQQIDEINAKFKNIFTEEQFVKYKKTVSQKTKMTKKTLSKQE